MTPSTFAKLRRVAAGLLLAAIVAGLTWSTWRGLYREIREVSPTPSSAPATSDSPASTSATDSPPSPGRARVLELLRTESIRVGRLTERPEDDEARLAEWASRVSELEADVLAERALDGAVPEDERFLAAELLARLSLDGNPARLERVVAAPFLGGDDPESARASIEWLVRARASEGFENFLSEQASANAREDAGRRLRELDARELHPFLRDRVRSALARYSNPKLPRSEERDAEALSRLRPGR
jgi:hypothetical protein